LYGQRVFLQRIGDVEPEGEGIARPRFRIVGQRQAAAERTVFLPGETAVAGETVLGHGVARPAVKQAVVLQPPDDGEQHRRVARPDGTGLPEQFGAAGVAQRSEFGSIGLDDGAATPVVDLMLIHPDISPLATFRSRLSRPIRAA
jgi:hypothetical protein